MPKLFAIQAVWCQSPEYFAQYKNAKDEHKYNYVTLISPDSDMSSYGWVRIGTAEVVCEVDPIEDGIAAAVAACDLAEEKLRNELNKKLAEIGTVKQNLLSLPAPKTSDGDEDDIPL